MKKWSPHDVPVRLVTTTEDALVELAALRTAEAFALDTETVVVRDDDGKPVKMDMDVDHQHWRVMYLAARHKGTFGQPVVTAWVLDMNTVDPVALNPVFAGLRPWGWNANFDRFVLARNGLKIPYWWDGMLFAAVIYTGAYYETGSRPFYTGLEAAAATWLGLDGIEGKGDTRTAYAATGELSDKEIRYAADDAIVNLELAPVLTQAAVEGNVYGACVRHCNAQPFIDAMVKNGLPLNVEGYREVVANAATKAAAASAELAALTTGGSLLTLVGKWAISAGMADKAQDPIDIGVQVLADGNKVDSFLAECAAQQTSVVAQVAANLGIEPGEDLFSEELVAPLPFDLDDATTIRRWLSKTFPVFTSEYIAAVGGTSKSLVAAYPLADIYRTLAIASTPDVTSTSAALAALLGSYARLGEILATYAGREPGSAVDLHPDWNVNSGDQVKAMLNRFAAPAVSAYTLGKDRNAHELGRTDKVDSDALKLIGGPVATALLEYRKHSKIVSTYGEEWIKYVHPTTGRVHAKYQQALTGTGRLNSHSPNAQNPTPLIKPFVTPNKGPGPVRRVLVQADLSQAELRFMGDMSGDKAMLHAFAIGEDLHVRTATLMFNIPLTELQELGTTTLGELAPEQVAHLNVSAYRALDPAQQCKHLFAILRQKAKAVGFGYAYGLKGASLARSLTVQGVDTTKEEADQLLAAFDAAYPQVAAWMGARVAFIQNLVSAMKDMNADSGCDFEATLRLHNLYPRALSASKALKKRLGHKPTFVEIAQVVMPDAELTENLTKSGQEVSEELLAATRAKQADACEWALSHRGSAVLAKDGTPWGFESRTVAGARRLFQVGTKDWVQAIVHLVALSRKPAAIAIRDAFEYSVNAERTATEAARAEAQSKDPRPIKALALSKLENGRRKPLTRDELDAALDSSELRNAFVRFALAKYGEGPSPERVRDMLFRTAVADQIRAMSNQYRNHPIQGGVADAVMDAFPVIYDALAAHFPTAMIIQSVHDSIVVECDVQDAIAIRDLLIKAMEEALAVHVPSVAVKADGDIMLSLDAKKDKLSDEAVNALVASLALAA